MSKAPSFWPLVASALPTIGSIVTCRPSWANRPSSWAMNRPASSATGTAPTVRLVGHAPSPFGISKVLGGMGADGQVAAGLALADLDLGRDALPELGYVADDAHHPASLAQAVEHGHHLLEGVLVEAAEALVDEQRLDPGAAGLGGDHVGEAEGQGQAGQERLAAGQRAGVAVHPGPAVAGEQAEAGPARAAAGVGVDQRVASRG